MKDIIKNLLRESLVVEFYGKNIIGPITKRFNDSSNDMINKLAIAYLFKQFFGDIMQYQNKQQFDNTFNKWYDGMLGQLIKTTSFPENRELAKKYLDAYINNIVLLGNKAQPFSMKKIEQGLVDLVNNNRWIKDEEISVGPTIEKPNQEDVVYEDDKVIILDTNTKAKCVIYGKGESWCITKPELNYYNTYRLSYGATPYFVLQKNVQGNERKIVIMNYGRDRYAIADRSNTGDRTGNQNLAMSWSQVEREFPSLTGLEDYFPYREITDDERRYAELLDKIKDNFIADDLQALVDRSIKGLVINGSQVTPADFIRDLAANRMSFNLEQLKSLRKDSMDSLIESGYFVNKYFDTKLYEEVLTPSQIKRIVNIKLESDNILDEAFYQYLSKEEFRDYMFKRLDAHNSNTGWSMNAREAKLSDFEVRHILEFFPEYKINTNRYDLSNTNDLYIVILIDPSLVKDENIKKRLAELSRYQLISLINKHPNLAIDFSGLDRFQEMNIWDYEEIILNNPKNYKIIINNLKPEVKAKVIDRLKYSELFPLLIRDNLLKIENETEYKQFEYELVNKNKAKAFVYKPELLRFVGSKYDLEEIMVQQPTLFKHLGDKIKMFDKYTIVDIMTKNPKSIKYIPKDVIDNIDQYRLYTAIYNKPILAKNFADKIELNYIIDIIKNVPKVVNYLPENVLKNLDKYDIISILYNKKLYPYMEPIIDKYMPDDKDFILDRI